MNIDVLSIDPGIFGAMAWSSYGDGVPIDAGACPLPYRAVGNRMASAVDIDKLMYQMRMISTPGLIVIEEPMMVVGGISRGSKGVRNQLENHGRILASVESVYGVEYFTILPSIWKKHLHLSSDKSESISMAVRNFPMCAEMLDVSGLKPTQKPYKRADGIAEALLIGLYGYHNLLIDRDCAKI